MERGSGQVQGVDYNEIFASVVSPTFICLLLLVVAYFDLKLRQMDVVTAFLNGDLNEEGYLEVPDGINRHERERSFGRPNNASYWLFQASRKSNENVNIFLVSVMNFEKCQNDTWLHLRHNKIQNMIIILAHYVDAVLTARNHHKSSQWMKRQLNQKIEMKKLSEAKIFVRLDIFRDHSSCILSVP